MALTFVIALPVCAQDSPRIWTTVCSQCHGTKVAVELRGKELPMEMIYTMVRQGISGMPAFSAAQISDDQLVDLSQWLSSATAPTAAP